MGTGGTELELEEERVLVDDGGREDGASEEDVNQV